MLIAGPKGYYDARDCNEAWIRISVKRGAMIALPAGIYHRFTVDSNNHFKVIFIRSYLQINTLLYNALEIKN